MRIRRLVSHLSNPYLLAALSLGAVNFAAYGLLAPWLGLYGDDWSYIWLLFKGPGMLTFLKANREAFIPFYEALARVLGPYPITWLFYMLLVRWINSYGFWLILNKLWPGQQRYIMMAALLYAVYPGFYLNSAAVNISMFLVVMTFFLYSIYLHLVWEETGRKKWLLLVFAGVFSIANITLTEYFFFMELIRPFIIYIFVTHSYSNVRSMLKETLKSWSPFLISFLFVLTWRTMFQSKINGRFSLELWEDFKFSPFSTLITQIQRMLFDLFDSGLRIWFQAVYPENLLNLPNAPIYVFFVVLIILAFLIFAIQQIVHKRPQIEPLRPHLALFFFGLGVLWFIISGWSIWLAKLEIHPTDFSTTRFREPFMPGAALIITSLIMLIPNKKFLKFGVFSLLLSSAITNQLLVANFFRMDWVRQESFFHQLTWRFPGLQPGTMVLISRNPLENGEENSISAAINWIYSTGNKTGVDFYAYFNPDKFNFDLGEIQPGKVVYQPHMVGGFTANLDRSVALYLDARNCIRVLYPGLDDRNSRLSDFMRANIPYTRPDEVLQPANAKTQRALKQVFGSEPEHDWCWLYQVADLSSRSGDWPAITTLADEYLHPDEYQNDWQKLLVFIEAYARQGEWGKAGKVFMNIGDLKPGERAVFCVVTRRWTDEINLDPGFEQLITDKRSNLNCTR